MEGKCRADPIFPNTTSHVAPPFFTRGFPHTAVPLDRLGLGEFRAQPFTHPEGPHDCVVTTGIGINTTCFGTYSDACSLHRWLILNSEMTPPIGASVRCLTSNRWMVGSSKVCEQATTTNPPNAIVSWEDGEGTFYLRERVEDDSLLPENSLETGLVHQGGTSAAVWSIGTSTFCKVKAWCEGLEPENDTIRFVARNAPCIPLPEVIYSWTDHDWNRSFLILRRVGGQTLQDAWPRLSQPQKSQIASQVAKYCSELAGITSLTFEGATHRGVLEPFLTVDAEPSHPSWKPRPVGPFSLEDFNSYLLRQSITHCPDIGRSLHFYHADLGPGNIMVSEEGNVEGILDWESAGFYPRCWIASKPMLSAGFYLSPMKGTKRVAWRDLLGRMLKKEDFEPASFTWLEPKA